MQGAATCTNPPADELVPELRSDGGSCSVEAARTASVGQRHAPLDDRLQHWFDVDDRSAFDGFERADAQPVAFDGADVNRMKP